MAFLGIKSIVDAAAAALGFINDIFGLPDIINKLRKKETNRDALIVQGHKKFIRLVRNQDNNINLMKKSSTEDDEDFPLGDRLADINTVVFMNYAGTAFLSDDFRQGAEDGTNERAKWFFENLKKNLRATMILTSPHSQAAKDAADNKMNSPDVSIPPSEIIQSNINKLLDFKEEHPEANIDLYLTDICLPYGIMWGTHSSKRNNNYMKVDLYSPVEQGTDAFLNDTLRPSFYLLEENKSTYDAYSHFENVIKHVRNTAKLYTGRSTEWITNSSLFVHRGRISDSLPEHSVRGFLECIRHGLPIESDLLFLSDDSIVIGRDEKIVLKGSSAEPRLLSSYTLSEIRSMHTDDYRKANGDELPFRFEETMEISEFLDLINGRVGLLIDAKIPYDADQAEIRKKVETFIHAFKYYPGNYAFVSANPFFLKEVRSIDRMVLLGQTSWSFDTADVSDEYRRLHTSFLFMNELVPDFICYKWQEVPGNILLKMTCEEHNLPLLLWTVHDQDELDKAIESSGSVNTSVIPVIEGSAAYPKSDL